MNKQRRFTSALAICAVLLGGSAVTGCGGKRRAVPAGNGAAAEVSGTSGDADTTTFAETAATSTSTTTTTSGTTATSGSESRAPATSTR